MPQPKQAPEAVRRLIAVDLAFNERIVLLQLLPDTGNIASLRLIRDLRESLEPSESEIDEFKVKVEDTRIRWDAPIASKAEPKHFDLLPRSFTLIEETIDRLSKSQKLPLAALSLYDKFCEKNAEPRA